MSVLPNTYWVTTGVVLIHMMNSADQLKNCTSASRFITSGMPAKSPTMLDSILALRPCLASAMPMPLMTP